LERFWLISGSLSALLSVVLGAFAKHGLQGWLSVQRMGTFETGVRYQMYHALALVFVGLLATRCPPISIKVAGFGFLVGTILFSGSLYVLALTEIRSFGAITPLGGLGFLIGWTALAIGASKLRSL
jgi:uncharacterized membrane protein YgdD (TMEM256/DUF423 family)